MINRIRENFTQVGNNILDDKELSLKAKGLYAFLCSKPDDWKFSYNGLSTQLQEGEKSIRTAVKELVDFGVLLRYSRKNGNDFSGWDWIINPTQEDLNTYTDPTKNGHFRKYPKQEVPKIGSSQKGNYISNIDLSNTNLSNTKEYISMLDFEKLYSNYPGNKGESKDKLLERLNKKKVEIGEIMLGLENEKRYKEIQKSKGEFVAQWKNMNTWINKECWKEEYNIIKKTVGTYL